MQRRDVGAHAAESNWSPLPLLRLHLAGKAAAALPSCANIPLAGRALSVCIAMNFNSRSQLTLRIVQCVCAPLAGVNAGRLSCVQSVSGKPGSGMQYRDVQYSLVRTTRRSKKCLERYVLGILRNVSAGCVCTWCQHLVVAEPEVAIIQTHRDGRLTSNPLLKKGPMNELGRTLRCTWLIPNIHLHAVLTWSRPSPRHPTVR